MRRAPSMFLILLVSSLIFVSDAFAQCPPRPGVPPNSNWCRARIQAPGITANPFAMSPQNTVPSVPNPGFAVPQAPIGAVAGGGVPAMPAPAIAMAPSPPLGGLPGVPPPPGGGPVQVQCFIDQVNFCLVVAPSMPPSGTGCYCGAYPGQTP